MSLPATRTTVVVGLPFFFLALTAPVEGLMWLTRSLQDVRRKCGSTAVDAVVVATLPTAHINIQHLVLRPGALGQPQHGQNNNTWGALSQHSPPYPYKNIVRPHSGSPLPSPSLSPSTSSLVVS